MVKKITVDDTVPENLEIAKLISVTEWQQLL